MQANGDAWFQEAWDLQYEDAAQKFEAAGKAYRAAGLTDRATEAFKLASMRWEDLGDEYSAAVNLGEAGEHAFAAERLAKLGKFSVAANVAERGAKSALQKQHYSKAIALYETAAQYYDGEGMSACVASCTDAATKARAKLGEL